MNRGWFKVGIVSGKLEYNFGTLIRSSFAFGASEVFTIGKRYSGQSGAVGTDRNIPIVHYRAVEDFLSYIPIETTIVCCELTDDASDLPNFVHPRQAIYLLGPEDGDIPDSLLYMSGVLRVKIQTRLCLNVAVAGSIIIYDRMAKELLRQSRPDYNEGQNGTTNKTRARLVSA